ncbi:MAG TPA: terpene cyclase/mutase family protein [Planctomycetota bacterium]|nr:terpene cyclase/mutase family protein [Planctomycetota bacterium]
MLCPHCNQDIPLNQQYCLICGKKVEVGLEDIESSVAADVADRRLHLIERILINVVGALVVIWVGLYLWNDFYKPEKFPGDRSGSFSFSAPPPDVKDESRLEPSLSAPVVPVPEIPRLEPRGMSWRRDPFRERLRETSAGAELGRDAANGVAAGLKFLAGRQDKDGGWVVSGSESGSPNNDWGRCGVTALACLAFLGDGHAWGADDKDPYANVVRKGIDFLVANQDESGRFGPKALPGGVIPHYMYNQGMATAAMAEAYAMTGDPRLRVAAQKGVNYILTAQQRSGGWDYYELPASRSDTSVTVWQVMALYSARQAGLNVPAAAFEKSLGFVDSMTDAETFRVGYDKLWTSSERGVGNGSTAIALMLQLYLGRSQSSVAVRRQSRLLLVENLPEYDQKWSPEQKEQKVDYYTTYHAALAFHRLGGKDWETWNKAMVKALRAAQESNGSWGMDKWYKQGGRIYSTALATMSLEVYYRYQ